MSLSASESVCLALRLVSARFLCPENTVPEPDENTRTDLHSAISSLAAAGTHATRLVKEEKHAPAYLRESAEALQSRFAPKPPPTIARAIAEIELIARHFQPDDDADPTCATLDGSTPFSAGILELLTAVEDEVRTRYLQVKAFKKPGPTISYDTTLINKRDAASDARPNCRVQGSTTTQVIPPVVSMLINDCDLNSSDLCHLAYVAFHELVCHAFFGAGSNSPKSNAFPGDRWAEGWMDLAAFVIADHWADQGAGPANWLPGEKRFVKDHFKSLHDTRYAGVPGLTHGRVNQRRMTRAAYDRLESVLAMYPKRKSAAVNAQAFTLLANAHAEATVERLELMATRLEALLFSDAKRLSRAKIAKVCGSFVTHRDLDRLDAELKQLSGL